MTALNRRKALSTIAAAPAAVALSGAPAQAEGPSELAVLIRRYWIEVEAFNNHPSEWTDEQANALAYATFDKTLRDMVGVPARTAEDAWAAMEWVTREGQDCKIDSEGCLYNRVAYSLANAARDYLAGRAA